MAEWTVLSNERFTALFKTFTYDYYEQARAVLSSVSPEASRKAKNRHPKWEVFVQQVTDMNKGWLSPEDHLAFFKIEAGRLIFSLWHEEWRCLYEVQPNRSFIGGTCIPFQIDKDLFATERILESVRHSTSSLRLKHWKSQS